MWRSGAGRPSPAGRPRSRPTDRPLNASLPNEIPERTADMRGRRPKPTRLKILSGNPGKRALNLSEPKPEIEVPQCPVELGPVARSEWDRLVVQLGALRILTQLDRAALAAYCGAYGMWAEATEAIQKYGTMVKSPSG